MKRVARYFAYLLATLLAGILVVYFYPQPLIMLWMWVNYSTEDFTRLEAIVDGKKNIGSYIEQCGGVVYSSHNIKLCISKSGLSRTETLAKDWYRYTFDNGSLLVVMGNIPSVFSANDTSSQFIKGISVLFKGAKPKDDYEFVLESLQARPSDISLLSSRDDALASAFMLSMKYTYLPPQVSAGHECYTQTIKCIQMGIPEEDKMVFVHVFDADMVRYQFIFNKFSQEQIDQVLRTITVK